MEQNSHNNTNKHTHHLVPFKVYVVTLIALLILTVLTVGVSYIDFGKGNIYVSMGIATIKASLVMLFFMGLRYDNNLNRAVILSSFGGLAIFFFYAAADSWTREKPKLVEVKAAAVAISLDELKKLELGSAELASKGKEIYNVNCASCHGTEGKGDGIAAAALNPHPRNFHGALSDWKNGASAKAIYVTLANGIPGTGMASYQTLPVADRWALVHYVRTFLSEKPASASGDAKYAAAIKADGIGGSGPAVKATIPIDFAIDRMTK